MNEFRRGILDLAVVVALVGGAAVGDAVAAKRSSNSTSPPATTRAIATTRAVAAGRGGSSDAAKSALRAAVAALSKEYEQFQRRPSDHPMREACNYFLDHPDENVTSDVVLAALSSPVGEPRAAAYVRWQLLSALPETVDEATAKQLIVVYRAAPAPLPRTGISRDDQQRMDRLTQSAKQADEPDIQRQVEEAVSAVGRQNAPILSYRDELYRRLPKNADTFAAAMDDLLGRCGAVADGKDLIKSLAKDVRAWLASDSPPPATVAALARAARKLADTKGPQYYQSVYFNERGGVFAWHKTRAGVDTGHALKDLAVLLEEQSQRPPLNLDIKDAAPPAGAAAKKK